VAIGSTLDDVTRGQLAGGKSGWGVAACFLSAAYLVPFVARGWVPHDEGTLGLNALRVMRGELPHVQFVDPYTGALSWVYAGLFAVLGVDVIWTRWLLYAGAIVATVLMFRIAREYAPPPAAAAVVLVAVAWGFPNYFAAMPSWWILIGALSATWLTLGHLKTGSLAALAVTGVIVGVCFTIKQTGIYLLIGLILVLAFEEQSRQPTRSGGRWYWASLGVRVFGLVALCGGLLWLVPPTSSAAVLLVLAAPMAALGLFVVCDEFRREETDALSRVAYLARAVASLVGGALLPVAVMLIPYLASHTVGAWFHGVFVAPQSRHGFGTLDLPPLTYAWPLVPLVVALLASLSGHGKSRVAHWSARCAWAIGFALLVTVGRMESYQLLWSSIRTGVALLVVATLAQLWRGGETSRLAKMQLYTLAAMTACLSLNQFPFAAPIYLCFVAPLAGLLLLGTLRSGGALEPLAIAALYTGLGAFAVASLNAGYVANIGVGHTVARLSTPLGLSRASITTNAGEASLYGALVGTIERTGRKRLHAFPDCPEVYFLTDSVSPMAAPFEFFEPKSVREVARVWEAKAIDVVVINHGADFSPKPSEQLLEAARARFPNSQVAGRFEVRWR